MTPQQLFERTSKMQVFASLGFKADDRKNYGLKCSRCPERKYLSKNSFHIISPLRYVLFGRVNDVQLATSSLSHKYDLKTAHLKEDLFAHFPDDRVIVGDDPRIPPGRGKPHPGQECFVCID